MKSLGALLIFGVLPGPFHIVADIRVQTNGFRVIPAGEFTQHIIAHALAAVAVHVGDVHIDANPSVSICIRHGGVPFI